jgi:peptide/nickel transport system permease protein
MWPFFVRRIVSALITFFSVILIIFVLFYVVGGDPAAILAGKNASPEALAQTRHELGLDQPLPLQFAGFLKNSVTLDWGLSWATKQKVSSSLSSSLGASLSLTIPAFLISVLLALGFAFVAAYKKSSWDHAIYFMCTLLMSFSFVVFILVAQQWLAFQWNLFPVYGWDPSWTARWSYLALPCLIYVVATLAPKVFIFRAALFNELQQDYVRTAYAKGLSPLSVFGVHIFKNASIPILTLVTSQVPSLITGSLLLEAYFGIPGVGHLLLKAIQESDLPVIQATTVLGTALYIFFNLVNDLLALALNPRLESL